MLWDASSSVRKAVACHIYETAFSHEGEEKNGMYFKFHWHSLYS
jgi:hypothetical protein